MSELKPKSRLRLTLIGLSQVLMAKQLLVTEVVWNSSNVSRVVNLLLHSVGKTVNCQIFSIGLWYQ